MNNSQEKVFRNLQKSYHSGSSKFRRLSDNRVFPLTRFNLITFINFPRMLNDVEAVGAVDRKEIIPDHKVRIEDIESLNIYLMYEK